MSMRRTWLTRKYLETIDGLTEEDITRILHKKDRRRAPTNIDQWIVLARRISRSIEVNEEHWKKAQVVAKALRTSISFYRQTISIYIQFRGIDFSGVKFTGMEINDATFTNCNLSGADFENSTLESATFSRCNLRGANLAHATLRYVSFNGSNVYEALHLTHAQVIQTRFHQSGVLIIEGGRRRITITPRWVQVGCRRLTYDQAYTLINEDRERFNNYHHEARRHWDIRLLIKAGLDHVSETFVELTNLPGMEI